MIRLEATYNKNNGNGVFVLSQVENPAMQGKNVLLSKEEPKPLQIALSDDDKQIVYCVALSPHVDVYRSADSLRGKEDGYITFSVETIEEVANDFVTDGQLSSGSLNHDEQTDKIKVIQSWTVLDAENDKSVALGMENIQGGEWIVGQEVLCSELWEQFKNGDYNGISIEGVFDMIEIKASEQLTEVEQFVKKVLN